MSKKSLEDQNYHMIRSAILDPEHSPLSEKQSELLERYISAHKVLLRFPVIGNAVKVHRSIYPDIGQAQAYRDIQTAQRLFTTVQTHDWDYWQTWLISDITRQIDVARTKQDLKAWNAGHMALIKAIGNRPEKTLDPKLVEKHTFVIQMNANHKHIHVDLDKINQIPKSLLIDIAEDMYTEIDENDAEALMKT